MGTHNEESRDSGTARQRRRTFLKTTGLMATGAALAASGGSVSATEDDEIERIVEELTLEEKVRRTRGAGFGAGPSGAAGYLTGYDDPDVPGLAMFDGPPGVAGFGPVEATDFPHPIAAAATFDPSLVARQGAAIAREVKYHDGQVLLGPSMDMFRVPLHSRSGESYGEDPHLAAEMAKSYAGAVQSEGVIATLKHFVGYNQTRTTGDVDDDYSTSEHDSRIGERALREIYYPPFEAAITEGNAGAVMPAYNRVNGTFSSEHEFLTAVLRDDWGFEGFTVSDWFGTHSTVQSAANGLDVEMPAAEHFGDPLLEAVENGDLDEAVVDEMVRRTLRAQRDVGFLDGDQRGSDPELGTDRHLDLARRIAEEGTVLLQNDGVLPLSADGLETLAVVGIDVDETSDATRFKNSVGGSEDVDPPTGDGEIGPVAGIEELVGGDVAVDAVFADEDDPDGVDAAVAAADAADATVVVAKTDTEYGDDRERFGLPGAQDELVERVADATDTAIVLLNTEAPVAMPWVDDVPAIAQVWFPGQEGGRAAANVLFGETDPSGRTPVTYAESLEDYLPQEIDTLPNEARGYPGIDGEVYYDEGVFVGYRHFDANGIEPLFPFGHGESYATFEYSDLRISPDRVPENGRVTVAVRVENTGDRAGREVVQAYVEDVDATVERPPKELAAVEKVALKPGQRRTVTLRVDADDLAFYDENEGGWTIEPGEFAVHVGRSSRDIRATGAFVVR